MTSREPFSENNLHAYVDGRLDALSLQDFEAWMRDDPQIAARVDAYRRQNAILHAFYDPIIDEDVPARLDALMATTSSLGRPSILLRIAAALLLFFVGAVAGWELRNFDLGADVSAGLPGYVERAVGAHVVYAAEIRHPVEVDASQEAHLVAWLSKRLGNPLKAPQLKSAGFELVGGRLLEDGGLPAAQFMYEDDTGRRVTVYVRGQQGRETAFKFSADHGVSAFYWIDAPFAYALAGDIPRQELLTLAHIVYAELGR